MYGIGIYFADMAGKTVWFCGIPRGKMALVLLCEVEVGTVDIQLEANYNIDVGIKVSDRYAAVSGLGYVSHKKWCDAGCVHPDLKGVLMPDVDAGKTQKDGFAGLGHNEFVVYDPAQVRQRYLFQVQIS